MNRNRTACLVEPAQAPETLPAPPPPPADIEEVTDPEKDLRLRRIAELLAQGQPEATIWRAIQREFAVPRVQAQADYSDVRDHLRRHLDDEGAIDGVIMGAMARLQGLIQVNYARAVEPIDPHVVDTPDAHPEDPHSPGPIYRPLTPQERATEVATRVAAGGLALKANDALVKLVGRRSVRWAERPNTVIQLGSANGLSDEDKELLKSLGMAQG